MDTTTSTSELRYDVLQHDLAESVFDIGWFPDRLGEKERRSFLAAGTRACEVRVSGIDHRDDRFDIAENILKQVALRCLLQIGAGFMLFRTLAKYGVRSRVRTHKGVFPWLDVSLRDLKTELERDREGESIIGGMLIVQEPWFEESWRAAGDYQRAVLLLASAPLSAAPDRALVERAMGALEGEKILWIDYPKLVARSAEAGCSILRRGGDAGETFVNLTLFGEPEMLIRFRRQVERSSSVPR